MKVSVGIWSGLIILALWVVAIIGYFVNIYKLVIISGPIGMWDAVEICRAIGIFVAPLGSFMGLFF